MRKVNLGLIVGVAVACLALSASATWYVAGYFSDRKVAREVNAVRQEALERIEQYRELNRFYREVAEEKFGAIIQQVSAIEVEHVTITRNVYHEVESNPEFYSQQLPEGGIRQWENARRLLQD